jgi:hypothetical protein
MINSKIFFACLFADYLTDSSGLMAKSGRTSVYLQVGCNVKKEQHNMIF